MKSLVSKSEGSAKTESKSSKSGNVTTTTTTTTVTDETGKTKKTTVTKKLISQPKANSNVAALLFSQLDDKQAEQSTKVDDMMFCKSCKAVLWSTTQCSEKYSTFLLETF